MPGGSRPGRDQRPRVLRAARPGRQPRLPRDRGRRHGHPVQVGHGDSRVPARVGDFQGGPGGAAGLPQVRRLQAQAAEPHEVHDPRAGMDPLARGIRTRADALPPERRGADARDRSGARRVDARLDEGRGAVGRAHLVACHGAEGHGTRDRADHHSGAAAGRRSVRPVAHDERATAEAVRLSDGDGHGAARGSVERADARPRRAGARLRRRHCARHPGSESRVPLGQRVRRPPVVSPAWRRQVSRWPKPAAWPMS